MTSSLDPNADTSLNLRQTFSAPRELVFRAWTEAEAIERWFRPMGQVSKVALLELHVGGRFRFDLTNSNGDTSSISGRYMEIMRPEKLVFTWSSMATDGEDTLVTVNFHERGNSTEIVLTHERLSNESMAAEHRMGWMSVIEQMADFL